MALGFSHPTLVAAWNRSDPKCLDSCVLRYAQDGRAPTSGPDALDGPPLPLCEEGRLVPRSPYPDAVWARVARLIAAGYSPTEAGAKVGMHRTTIWGAWQEHTDFRYRTYWEYVSLVREARAKLRRHNALLAPSWTLPPDDEGRLDRPLPPIIPDNAGPHPNPSPLRRGGNSAASPKLPPLRSGGGKGGGNTPTIIRPRIVVHPLHNIRLPTNPSIPLTPNVNPPQNPVVQIRKPPKSAQRCTMGRCTMGRCPMGMRPLLPQVRPLSSHFSTTGG